MVVLTLTLPLIANCKYIGDYKKDSIKYDTCNLPQKLLNEIHSYEDTANTIINTIVNGKFKVSKT